MPGDFSETIDALRDDLIIIPRIAQVKSRVPYVTQAPAVTSIQHAKAEEFPVMPIVHTRKAKAPSKKKL